MDVVGRIRELNKRRNWSDYRLAKEAGIPQSTLSNLLHRGNIPSLYTLERICQAFGISLSEFFASPCFDYKALEEDEESRQLVILYNQLNDIQKRRVFVYITSLMNETGVNQKNCT